MELRKWDDHDNACTTCIIYETCLDEELLDKCTSINPKYYAHKDDISAMVEWAEEWNRKEGGHVVCNKYEEGVKCNECGHAKPHKHTGSCFSVCCGERIDCIAYRGEDSKPEDDECVKCNATPEFCIDCEVAYRGLTPKHEDVREYVVVKELTFETLADSDISGELFKLFYTQYVSINFTQDAIISDPKSYIHINASELIRCGFIEEKVHDPVVTKYDYIVDSEGNGGVYRLNRFNDDEYRVVSINHSDSPAPSYSFISESHNPEVKMSKIFGKDNMKRFRIVHGVEIKITEVED